MKYFSDTHFIFSNISQTGPSKLFHSMFSAVMLYNSNNKNKTKKHAIQKTVLYKNQ